MTPAISGRVMEYDGNAKAGDIARYEVIACLFGTVELPEPEERPLIKEFVINKFKGDASSAIRDCVLKWTDDRQPRWSNQGQRNLQWPDRWRPSHTFPYQGTIEETGRYSRRLSGFGGPDTEGLHHVLSYNHNLCINLLLHPAARKTSLCPTRQFRAWTGRMTSRLNR